MPNETTTGAPALPQQDAPVQNDSSVVSLALSVAAVNPVNSGDPGDSGNSSKSRGKKFKRGKETHVLPADAKVNSLAVKCYVEQLPYGEAYLMAAITGTNPKDFHVIGIRHVRDTVTDGIWANPMVKPHWHVIVRLVDSKKRMRVLQILKGLGIYFCPGVDDGLWLDHGVETIGNYAGYALYLTHETADAIRDGKEKYEMHELVSNLTIEQIEDIRAGYIRVTAKKKLAPEELAALDQEAYDLGCKMGNFDAWYGLQPFIVRSSTKIKTIRESYSRGVEVRIVEDPKVIRLCVFIKGGSDSGKTYAAIEALAGKRVLSVGGGGTGKFDRLRPDHNAIVIDDDVCPNLLNMSDNYICHAYRRRSDNPAWAGDHLIVTSNLTFDEWLEKCGIDDDEHKKAVRSRFYICEVHRAHGGFDCLKLVKPSKRGMIEEQAARLEMFRKFRAGFDASICKYSHDDRHVDYSADINSTRIQDLEHDVEQYEMAQPDALVDFGRWFWSSTLGGFAGYLEKHPEEQEGTKAEFRLLRDDAVLEKAVKDCLPYFRGETRIERHKSDGSYWPYLRKYELVETIPMNLILKTVKLAWEGEYGDVPPLTEDPGYEAWSNRVLKDSEKGHKLCPSCLKAVSPRMGFCGKCGKLLPDKVFFGGPEFDRALVWLAGERNCGIEDIPEDDVKARVYHADGNEDY